MRRRTAFTVIINHEAGIGDQLDRLVNLHKFGRSLGYTYLHTPLQSTRQISVPLVAWPRWPERLRVKAIFWLARRQDRACKTYHNNIYNFIGLNQYFSSRNENVEQQPHTDKWEVLNAPVFPKTSSERNLLSRLEIREAQRHIKRRVQERSNPLNPCLVRLHSEQVFGVLNPIPAAPGSIDDLNLRAIYFEQRRKHPYQSKFPRGKLKTLVHLRLGDFAVIKTPWDTWLHKERFISYRWQECRGEETFRQLTVADFHAFVQHLVARFSDDTLAVQFSSDGFNRTFNTLNQSFRSNPRHPQITEKQMRLLNKHRHRYNREFKRLMNGVKNSVSTIGETLPNLFNFIASVLTADLIIAAFPVQHTTTQRLLKHYTDSENMPAVILLYKPCAKEQMQHFFSDPYFRDRRKKIIPVNVAEPDFDQIIRRLNAALPPEFNISTGLKTPRP